MGSYNEPVPQGSATFVERVLPSQQADMNLAEPNRTKHKFGNPAALGLTGFLMCNTPVTIDLMGWGSSGGSTGNAAASMGAYFSFGGTLMMIAAIADWIMGNTVSSVVFGTFGCFWVTYAATMVPWFAAVANYETTSPTGVKITDTASYNASFATWMIFMAVMCSIFMLCSIRANLALVVMQLFFVITFALLPMSFWYQAAGEAVVGRKLQIAAGAVSFTGSCIGWYIFISVMFEAADFPLTLPLGDLSRHAPHRKVPTEA